MKDVFNPKHDQILEIDMHDFLDNHFASNLIGAPSGYVGYETGGILSEHLVANPFSIIVLKNYHNANPEIKGIIKRAIANGVLIDNKRRTLTLQNSIFILENQKLDKKIGFLKSKEDEILDDMGIYIDD